MHLPRRFVPRNRARNPDKQITYKLVRGTDGTVPGDRLPTPNVPSCQFTSMGLRDQLGPQALKRVEDAVRAGSARGRRPWWGPPPRRGQHAFRCYCAIEEGDRAALNEISERIRADPEMCRRDIGEGPRITGTPSGPLPRDVVRYRCGQRGLELGTRHGSDAFLLSR
ncbi:hypothetical protein PHLGIDRAFT_270555 [Phlebiopsis gigantea 11061_1 CR5-6]|uniref:Uncharacterized protein n=1 Tax=Phlebiopsis gigantea (strain 11061_1 CR5-6) TaxID=745531 RepID=A0A0C3S171_PHLG1|nr:hypothetical protein PHLGIDRAFT_270555 [Phlebiopsis gigantea 11061_1 CR5-6]